MQSESTLKIPMFYAVNEHQNTKGYARLLREVRNHQLAGLIFAYNPQYVEHTELLQNCDVPLVAITHYYGDLCVPSVEIGYTSFLDRALDAVVEAGDRNVAILAPHSFEPELKTHFEQGVGSRGLQTHDFWWQPVYLRAPEQARYSAHLLMNPYQTLRPDVLIVADDNLLEHAVVGLKAAGVRIPQDLRILAHSNFPSLAPPPVPVRRLGYSVPGVLDKCIELLNQQRAGQPVASLTTINAIFEDEIATSQTSSKPG